MVLAHVLRDLEQRMTEALKNMMNVCLFQRKQVPLQISKRRRSQNLFYVYICKSTKQEGRGGEHSPPLILYMEKEKAKKDVLGEGLPIYDGIYFCQDLFFVVIIKE